MTSLTPKVLTEADLAGLPRAVSSEVALANYTFTIVADSDYESTTEGRCSAKQYGAVIYALHNDDSYQEQRDRLAVERDELASRVRELESAALAAQPGAVGEANTELIAHMRLLNEYVEACNAGVTKTHLKAADAARQKVEASALSLISAKARSEPDCAGGMPCTDCPDKRKCQAGCVKQEEALKRPYQKSAQRHPLDVQALYELQAVMADFGGDWPDVPGEQEVVRRAKMLSRLWKSESTTQVVGLNGRQRMLLAQAWTMLEDYAEGNRRAGNGSFADGAIASAHEIKLMLAAAPTEAKPAPKVSESRPVLYSDEYKKPAQDAVDAERYRELRRGMYWSVVDVIGDHLRDEALDGDVDRAISAKKSDS